MLRILPLLPFTTGRRECQVDVGISKAVDLLDPEHKKEILPAAPEPRRYPVFSWEPSTFLLFFLAARVEHHPAKPIKTDRISGRHGSSVCSISTIGSSGLPTKHSLKMP